MAPVTIVKSETDVQGSAGISRIILQPLQVRLKGARDLGDNRTSYAL